MKTSKIIRANWRNVVSLVAITAVMCLFCEMERYNYHALAPLSTTMTFSKEEEGIQVFAKVYTAEESKSYLQRDLLMRGYQPIQITVHNNTSKPWVLYPEGIDLPVVTSKRVASLIIRSALPRSIGLKIASFFFWPFTIPSTIDSIRTLKAHKKLKRDLAAKSIKPQSESVPAYSIVNRVFFVKLKDYPGKFSITLMDQETEELKEFPIKAD